MIYIICIYIYIERERERGRERERNRKRVIGQMNREFANGLGDRSSIPGQVIPKTQK